MIYITSRKTEPNKTREIGRLKLLRSGPDLTLALARLLRQQGLVNVRQDTSVRDRHRPQQLAQLLVVPHRQLYVPRHNSVLLVVPRRIPSKLQHLNQP
ncbi:hypothetical protein CDL15_Pgr020266 [Punica granatum]|uniref:Uncharacterized protein n=1 Tax=Punica granatum TaxID=22663 RepID=A0A218VST2_PUNGR|nr:hypothetical protein CDL15_Pgr020266 [Punica granatum]